MAEPVTNPTPVVKPSTPAPKKAVDIKVQLAEQLAVEPDTVWAYKDYGTYIIVVTSDGQKHEVAKP